MLAEVMVEPFVSPRAVSPKELHRSFVRVSTRPRPVWHFAAAIECNLTEQFTDPGDVLAYVEKLRNDGYGLTPRAAQAISQILAEGTIAAHVGMTFQCPATYVSGKKCLYNDLHRSTEHILPRLTALTLLPFFSYDWIEEGDSIIPVTDPVVLEDRAYYPVLLGNGPTLDYREVHSYVLGPETNVILAGYV